jgi:hypothetical protein
VVEKLHQEMLLAELVAHKNDSSARSVDHITQEMLGFAKLNLLRSLEGSWGNHILEHRRATDMS